MDPHTRHTVPARRREYKTVFADSRWKRPAELMHIDRPEGPDKQEEKKCASIV